MYLAYGDPRSDEEAWSIASKISNTFWVKNWGIDLRQSDFVGVRTYRKLVETIFGAWNAKSGGDRLCDKTPHNVLYLPTLLHIFPDAQIIHLIRDGRDASMSWLFSRFEPRNMYTAAQMWKKFVSAGIEGRNLIDESSFLEIRYEDLVENESATLNAVYKFVGEDMSLAGDTDTSFSTKRVKLSHKNMTANVRKPMLTSNTAKWKKEMSTNDLVIFESVAGDLLADLGYEVVGRTRTIGSIEKVAWKVHHTFLYYGTRLFRPHFLERTRTYLINLVAGIRRRM